MDALTRQLADHAASLTFDQIPPDIVHRARQSLLDALGCAMGGLHCDSARIARRLAAGAVPNERAGVVLCGSERAPMEEAAFINTAMIRYLDFNDAWHAGHPSDMLGGLLAASGMPGVDGKRLLTAMVVSYETAFRVIPPTQMREKGWDQGYVIGIATACGVGHLLQLDADRLAHAIAITAVANVPMRATRAGQLSMWKGAATAFACRNAVYATLLAADGMTGPEGAFEGRHGLWEQITGPFEIDPFGPMGGGWKLPLIRLKYWPVEYNAQAGVWAALQLRAAMKLEEIEAIDIATYWSAWHEIGSEAAKWDPTTRETADHSLPYIFARTLADGTISVASFDEVAYRDPALRPLMAKITVREDPAIEARYPREIVMRVTARARRGRSETIEIVDPRGDNRNPMNDEEVRQKFRGLATPVLGEAATDAALTAWWEIERAADLGQALGLLIPERTT
jgi:2-methylcitrate dehydratase